MGGAAKALGLLQIVLAIVIGCWVRYVQPQPPRVYRALSSMAVAELDKASTHVNAEGIDLDLARRVIRTRTKAAEKMRAPAVSACLVLGIVGVVTFVWGASRQGTTPESSAEPRR